MALLDSVNIASRRAPKRRLSNVWNFVALFGLLVGLLPALSTERAVAQSSCETFTQTGKKICGKFLDYWNKNGGLSQQGYPLTDEVEEKSETDGKTYTVQYFERAVFEAHPDNKAPYDILLQLLGNFEYRRRHGADGAPDQKASTTNALKFDQTGKTVGGKFREYWEKNGGLAQQGYPISNEFQERSNLDGKTYTVQYFERAVFELHTENAGTQFEVLLSQLGKFRLDLKTAGTGTTVPPDAQDKLKALSGQIVIDGSSTVYPIIAAASEEFNQWAPDVRVPVGISGTGGGFTKFCAGETDISNASRPITPVEVQRCKDKQIQFIELPVAYDGLAVVVNPRNTWATSLSVAELKKIWEPAAGEPATKISNWNQVREAFLISL